MAVITQVDELEQIPTLDEVGQCMLDAANLLEQHGWCQCTTGNEYGEHCAVGAIESVLEGIDIYKFFSPAVQRLGAYIIEKENLPFSSSIFAVPEVTHWNDQSERTKEEVISALRNAATGG